MARKQRPPASRPSPTGQAREEEPCEELPLLDRGIHRGEVGCVRRAAVDDEELDVGELLGGRDRAVGELTAPADDEVVALRRELAVHVCLVGDTDVLGHRDVRAELGGS